MSLSILFIGGTGQISLPVVEQAWRPATRSPCSTGARRSVRLPNGVTTHRRRIGTTADPTQARRRRFDVVCQFRAYTPEQMRQDIATFTGRIGQYIFISSASAYQKPAHHYVITERTPLENPYWQYSRDKATCETDAARAVGLPWTIVRPSHTVRTGMPIQIGDARCRLRRMLDGRPVIVTGDGTSLWTLTRSADFAPPVRPPVWQRGRAGRGFPDHLRPRASPGTRSPPPSRAASASRRHRPRADRHADPLQQAPGRDR